MPAVVVVLVVSTHETCSLAKHEIHSTVLSATVTTLSSSLWNSLILHNSSVCPLTSMSPVPPGPGDRHAALCFCEFDSFGFHVCEIIQCLSLSDLFHLM